jgi:hypothetical protein
VGKFVRSKPFIRDYLREFDLLLCGPVEEAASHRNAMRRILRANGVRTGPPPYGRREPHYGATRRPR